MKERSLRHSSGSHHFFLSVRMLARGECEHFDFLHLPSGWVFPGHFVGCEMTLRAARLISCSATKWVAQDMGLVFLPKRLEFLPNNGAQSMASLTPPLSLKRATKLVVLQKNITPTPHFWACTRALRTGSKLSRKKKGGGGEG